MTWDPLARLPVDRRWLWTSLAAWACLLRGPALLESLHAPRDWEPDFFQEYASARNLVEGLPVYTGHEHTVERYLGRPLDPDRSVVLVNAHPPTSVLLALPLAWLDFDGAFLAWNIASLLCLVASLWLMWRGLWPDAPAWGVAPLTVLLLTCHPLREQCRQGQLNFVLLLLLTGAWSGIRSGRARLGGILIGLAATIKVFPVFMLIYFAWRRRWAVVAAGAAAMAGATALTVGAMGRGPYQDYLRSVLPRVQWFRVGWNNASAWGFWSRLFDPAPHVELHLWHTEALYYEPALALGASLLTCAGILAAVGWATRPGGRPADEDEPYGLAMTAMLLVAPIVWEHYFVLLLLPLGLAWRGLPQSPSARVGFLAIVLVLWLDPAKVWSFSWLGGQTARPHQAIGVLALPFYALLALFALQVAELRPSAARAAGSLARRHGAWLGAVAMAAMWIYTGFVIWRTRGLFDWIGIDFAIYRSIATSFLASGPSAVYDLDAMAEHLRPLAAYYGPWADDLKIGPGPYPAIYLLPFLPLAGLSPHAGFLAWSAANLLLALVVSRDLAGPMRRGRWWGIAMMLLFFPVSYAVFVGQVTIILLFAFHRAYRAFERGEEFRAGMWSGVLLLKPQYAVFLAIVLLFKRRWHAVSGMAATGLILAAGSWALVGTDGLWDYVATLRAMSGFRRVHPIVCPDQMINWRGLLVNLLPADVGEARGLFLTGLLSVATVATLPWLWRHPWDPRSERFAVQLLGLMIVTMMASLHNHSHGAALLLVPGTLLLARGKTPFALRGLILAAGFAPLFTFFATQSARHVSWVLICVMLGLFAAIIRAELAELAIRASPAASDPVDLPSPTPQAQLTKIPNSVLPALRGVDRG